MDWELRKPNLILWIEKNYPFRKADVSIFFQFFLLLENTNLKKYLKIIPFIVSFKFTQIRPSPKQNILGPSGPQFSC